MDPEMRQAAIAEAGRILAAEARAEMLGGLESLIWIDVTVAAQFLGISRKSAISELPTRRMNSRTTSVRLSDLKKFADGQPVGCG